MKATTALHRSNSRAGWTQASATGMVQRDVVGWAVPWLRPRLAELGQVCWGLISEELGIRGIPDTPHVTAPRGFFKVPFLGPHC